MLPPQKVCAFGAPQQAHAPPQPHATCNCQIAYTCALSRFKCDQPIAHPYDFAHHSFSALGAIWKVRGLVALTFQLRAHAKDAKGRRCAHFVITLFVAAPSTSSASAASTAPAPVTPIRVRRPLVTPPAPKRPVYAAQRRDEPGAPTIGARLIFDAFGYQAFPPIALDLSLTVPTTLPQQYASTTATAVQGHGMRMRVQGWDAHLAPSPRFASTSSDAKWC